MLKSLYLLLFCVVCGYVCDELCGGVVTLRRGVCGADMVITLPSDGSGLYNLVVNASMPVYSNENIHVELENAEAVQAGTAGHLVYVLSHPSCDINPLITRLVMNGRLVCKNNPYKANVKHAATQFSHESTHYGVVRKRTNPSQPNPNFNQPQLQALDFVIGPQFSERFGDTNKPVEPVRKPSGIEGNDLPTNPQAFPNNPFLASLTAPVTTPPKQSKPTSIDRFPTRIQSESNQASFTNNPFLNGRVSAAPPKNAPPTTTPRPIDVDAVCGYSTYALIQGGSEVQSGEFAWLGALFTTSSNTYRCTVNLVTQKHVLTAAHCFATTDDAAAYGILWGHPKNGRGQRPYNRLQSIRLHPDYNQSTIHDVALVTLAQGVTFTHSLKPICLWHTLLSREATPTKGAERGMVAGFGPDYTDLKKIEFPIVSQEACLSSNHYFHFITSEYTFCAGTRNSEEGPCKGDSGAGYMQFYGDRYYLRGLVSHSLSANGNCNLKEFIIFADLAKEMDWVQNALATAK